MSRFLFLFLAVSFLTVSFLPKESVADSDLESVADLEKGFVPFKDIVIIQKKFLPKSKRFEVSPGFVFSLSNPYYNNVGVSMRLSYSFVEKYSFDLFGQYLIENQSEVTHDLIQKQIRAFLPSVQNYMGGSLRWNPVYGKLALFQNKIVYFDMYFAIGMGRMNMKLSKGNDSESDFYPAYSGHVRMGQIYALSKSFATYWDLAFHMGYISKNNEELHLDNRWYLTLGFSWFYPEASYR